MDFKFLFTTFYTCISTICFFFYLYTLFICVLILAGRIGGGVKGWDWGGGAVVTKGGGG